MADAITPFDKACQTASDAIRSSINAAPDAATLVALDITTGYPS